VTGNILLQALYDMMPAYAALNFKGGADVMSLLLAMIGVGAAFAALWIAVRGSSLRMSALSLAGMLLAIISAGLFISTSSLVIAVLAVILFGAANEIRRTSTITLIQTHVEDGMRGRVMGISFLIHQMSGVLGVLFVGTLADHVGLVIPMMILLAVCLVCWGWLYLRRTDMRDAFVETGKKV
ncbi:MAG: MFS transporter, partial [Acidiferrobacterales bacterium]